MAINLEGWLKDRTESLAALAQLGIDGSLRAHTLGQLAMLEEIRSFFVNAQERQQPNTEEPK